MSNTEVTCVTKPDRFSKHEHITQVGLADGRSLTREQIINLIESKKEAFHVRDPLTGKVAHVGVVRESGKVPFIRTYADGYWNDNLLALKECPVRSPWGR